MKTIARCVVGSFFVYVGVLHFVTPDVFVAIVPPYLPAALALVYISGVFELLGGVGLLVPKTRRAAAWGLLALLVAVYPANIHMLVNEIYLKGMAHEKWILWARMPFQFLFALGVSWTGDIWPCKKKTEAD